MCLVFLILIYFLSQNNAGGYDTVHLSHRQSWQIHGTSTFPIKELDSAISLCVVTYVTFVPLSFILIPYHPPPPTPIIYLHLSIHPPSPTSPSLWPFTPISTWAFTQQPLLFLFTFSFSLSSVTVTHGHQPDKTTRTVSFKPSISISSKMDINALAHSCVCHHSLTAFFLILLFILSFIHSLQGAAPWQGYQLI